MKTAQKSTTISKPVKRKGRYSSIEEALVTKQKHLLATLKDIDLSKLTS